MRTRTALIVTLATVLICTALAQITLTTGQPNQWKIEIVDNEVDTASSTSIALDNNGNPHISYCSSNGELKYVFLSATPVSEFVWIILVAVITIGITVLVAWRKFLKKRGIVK